MTNNKSLRNLLASFMLTLAAATPASADVRTHPLTAFGIPIGIVVEIDHDDLQRGCAGAGLAALAPPPWGPAVALIGGIICALDHGRGVDLHLIPPTTIIPYSR